MKIMEWKLSKLWPLKEKRRSLNDLHNVYSVPKLFKFGVGAPIEAISQQNLKHLLLKVIVFFPKNNLNSCTIKKNMELVSCVQLSHRCLVGSVLRKPTPTNKQCPRQRLVLMQTTLPI